MLDEAVSPPAAARQGIKPLSIIDLVNRQDSPFNAAEASSRDNDAEVVNAVQRSPPRRVSRDVPPAEEASRSQMPGPANSGQPNTIEYFPRSAKRPRLRGSPERPRSEPPWSSWLQAVTTHIDTCEPDLTAVLERPRYRMLQSACALQDTFYVVLHQLYCLWTSSKGDVFSILPLEHDVTNAAFGILRAALKSNDEMRPYHITWLSQFPISLKAVSFRMLLRDTILAVTEFLKRMVLEWKSFFHHIIRRKFPITHYEAQHVLLCRSPLMASVLFTITRRSLGVENGHFGNLIQGLYEEDVAMEQLLIYQSASPEGS